MKGVTKVTEAIIRSKAGIKDPTKPYWLPSYSWDLPAVRQSLPKA